MNSKRTVVLVEHAFLAIAGMEKLLAEIPGMSITKVFDGSEKNLTDKIKAAKPDVLFVNPLAVADNLNSLVNRIAQNDCLLIGLTTPDSPPNIKSLFKYHISINDAKFELLETLKSIVGNLTPTEESKSEGALLSDREKTILKEVASGLTTQDIADKLFLSIHTVNTHRKNITNKLGIKTASGLTVYALMNKIIKLEEIDRK